jgi:Fe-S cluster biogenesis protein NfuA
MTVEITEDVLRKILESIKNQINAHGCSLELGEIHDRKVVIYCGGKCTSCDSKCVEDALKERVSDIEVIYR